MVEWRKQFASCKSVTRNSVLSTENFSSTDYDNCCLYYIYLQDISAPTVCFLSFKDRLSLMVTNIAIIS